jgi:hypothetical protein
VLAKSGALKHPDLHKTYYWYSSNKILSTVGSCEGKLLHGQYTSSYLNNNLREKGRYKMGLKQGKWLKWYENGFIQETSEWKKGDKHGTFQNFNANGELISVSDYCNDKLNGETIIYESGKIVTRKNYKNGVEILPEKNLPKPAHSKKIKKDAGAEQSMPQDSLQVNKPEVKNIGDDKNKKKSKPDSSQQNKNSNNVNGKTDKHNP